MRMSILWALTLMSVRNYDYISEQDKPTRVCNKIKPYGHNPLIDRYNVVGGYINNHS